MTQRTYEIPMTGRVKVDAKEGVVEVEVDLVDLPLDLGYDYEHPYSEAEVKKDGDLIQECLAGNPGHWSMTHKMTKEEL